MKFENDSQQENFNPNFPIKSSVCQRGKECKRFKSRMTLIVGHRRQHERVLQRECEAISTLQDIAERLECIPGIECNELAIWARKKWIEANEMREAEEFSKRSKRAIIERKREMGETIDFDG